MIVFRQTDRQTDGFSAHGGALTPSDNCSFQRCSLEIKNELIQKEAEAEKHHLTLLRRVPSCPFD